MHPEPADKPMCTLPRQASLYQPLESAKEEIRLLLIPRKSLQDHSSEAPVQYTLFHAPLEEACEFFALSYCWGTCGLIHKIQVNGTTTHVTESLALALRSLQSEEKDVVLWADAVCINQSDSIEKTSQVQMMQRIYKTARQVIIWLGLSTPDTDRAMMEIRRLGQHLLQLGFWELGPEHFLDWTIEEENGSDEACTKREVAKLVDEMIAQVQKDEHPFWWTTSDLGKRGWFHRVWCIQECSNAQIATFRCGQQQADYKCIWAVACCFSITISRGFLQASSDPEMHRKLLWHLGMLPNALPWTILGIRRKFLTGRGQDLRSLLDTANVKDSDRKGIDATDPRDRVYALLGIAIDDAAKSIVADYSLSCEEAYIMTARALLRHGHDDILSLCRFRGVCRDLPSWVPDWSGPLRKPWSIWYPNERLYSASGPRTPHVPDSVISNHENTLSRHANFSGAFVETIKSVGQEFRMGLNDEWHYPSVLQYFHDIASYLSQSAKYTAFQKQEAQWRLPVGDTELTEVTNQMRRAKPGSDMKIGYDLLKRAANGDVFESFSQQDRQACGFYQSQMSRMYDSKPFLSESGYVGVCPVEAKVGDQIVILMGARVPYVLRKSEDGVFWRLIGEVHVHGIMDGEFMGGDPKIEKIVLG